MGEENDSLLTVLSFSTSHTYTLYDNYNFSQKLPIPLLFPPPHSETKSICKHLPFHSVTSRQKLLVLTRILFLAVVIFQPQKVGPPCRKDVFTWSFSKCKRIYLVYNDVDLGQMGEVNFKRIVFSNTGYR